MSYRSLKRVLGETSLERKCRFLFGGALMLLIAGSFYFYAQRNLAILRTQNRQRAELLIAHIVLSEHWQRETPFDAGLVKELASELTPVDLKAYNWKFL